jgi:uncharacterized protein YndB with AHSA1/START domain
MTLEATSSSQSLLVKKSLFVAAAPARAFNVFTEHMGSWWPLASHHIGKVDAVSAVIEPRVGGRWFEKGNDGSECTWGHVLAWEPPGRLVLSWEISAEWAHDPTLHTEVEVRFVPEGNGTRVELEHRLLENFGAKGPQMAGIFDSDGGWTGLLAAFAARAVAS